ncbi:MAG: enoyl-CoA hydratase [Rhodobacteraceae bacterium]|nr:enoyl-CoA hydratase [Paracoccaceae bacterium]
MDGMTLADGRIVLGRDGPVGRITFNQPARMNAMSLAMWDGLKTALQGFADDTAVRVVVLDGAGDKAFVSGADISEFDRLRATPEGVADYNARSEAADHALYSFPKPTIAQIKGFCVGGGMGIALACDLRICADDARLGITAARLGLGYGLDGVRKLVQLAGPAVAADVLYSARLMSAGEALSNGLVNRVVAPADLAQTVAETAARIADNAPLTVEAAKAAIRAVQHPETDAAARIAALTDACFASADYAEGRRAFAEKRKPVFARK